MRTLFVWSSQQCLTSTVAFDRSRFFRHTGRAWDQAELERLRALVAERDIEVADLGSQLQVLKARLAVHGAAGAAGGQAGAGARSARSPGASPGPAYRAGGRGTAAFLSPSRERAAAGGAGAGSGPAGGRAQSAERERGAVAGGGAGSSEDAAVIETLRRQLARSDAALRGAKERLSMVEARAAVAHESAGKGGWWVAQDSSAALIGSIAIPRCNASVGDSGTHYPGASRVELCQAIYLVGLATRCPQASSSWRLCTAAWWARRWSTSACSRSWRRRGARRRS